MKRTKDQSGIISIFTATLLILILSLLVLGLAQISRREQRVALDTQLSTQAFYAAESGINDAVAAIQDELSNGGTPGVKESCGDDADYPTLDADQAVIDADHNVSYSCLLINPTPDAVRATLNSSPSVLALTPEHPAQFTNLQLNWSAPSGATGQLTDCPSNPAGNASFVPRADWQCPLGVVRVDLVRTNSVTRTDLRNNTATFFLVPSRSGSGAVTYTSLLSDANNGQIIAGTCTAAACTANITMPVGGGNSYMRATALYRSNFDLTATPNSQAGDFVGSQATVDVTGRAQDVLRRLLVNVNLAGNQPGLATAALMSGDSVCKRFSITAGGGIVNQMGLAGGDGNPLCEVTAGGAAMTCNEPHDIVLVLDESDSMSKTWTTTDPQTRQQELKAVAKQYVSNTARSDGNHVALVRFSSKTIPTGTEIVLPLSDNPADLGSHIDAMTLRSGTYYSNGLQLAEDILLNQNGQSGARNGVPKIIVFVSDGKPNLNEGGDNESNILALTSRLKNRDNITIYTVGIVSSKEATDSPAELLSKMATNPTGDSDKTTEFYTTVLSQVAFSDFFSGIRDDISCDP